MLASNLQGLNKIVDKFLYKISRSCYADEHFAQDQGVNAFEERSLHVVNEHPRKHLQHRDCAKGEARRFK
jgi:hypothetical protein